MAVVDTHCHLDIIRSRGLDPEEALRNAAGRDVSALIQIAVDLKSSLWNRDLAKRLNHTSAGLPDIYWTAGLHPGSVDELETLGELFELIRSCRQDPYFFGIGETGLDYYHTTEFVEEQRQSFAAHLDLAAELKLPVVLHLRDRERHIPGETRSIQEALEMVTARRGVRGVLHCFTYGYEESRPFVDLGWFVSFSGVLTYRNAESIREGAVRLPLDSLLVETDAPFLAPEPHRGKTNEPAFTADTLEFLAGLRAERLGEDPEVVKTTIYQNTLRFIDLKNSL